MSNLSQFLSTASGLDKSLMIIQYPAKFIVPLLLLLAKKSRGNKEIKRGLIGFAGDVGRLSATISDTRTMMRLLGELAFQLCLCLSSPLPLSAEPGPTPHPSSLTGIISLLPSLPSLLDPKTPLIQSLQLISLLIYYPLENLTYLSSHDIFKLSPARELRWSVWSCRAWAAYVGLDFITLWERWQGLKVRERELLDQRKRVEEQASQTTSEKPSSLVSSEDETSSTSSPTLSALHNSEIKLQALRTSFLEDLVSNIGYAPLTIHWSLYSGLWTNPAWTGVFGTMACLAGIRRGWRGMPVV